MKVVAVVMVAMQKSAKQNENMYSSSSHPPSSFDNAL